MIFRIFCATTVFVTHLCAMDLKSEHRRSLSDPVPSSTSAATIQKSSTFPGPDEQPYQVNDYQGFCQCIKQIERDLEAGRVVDVAPQVILESPVVQRVLKLGPEDTGDTSKHLQKFLRLAKEKNSDSFYEALKVMVDMLHLSGGADSPESGDSDATLFVPMPNSSDEDPDPKIKKSFSIQSNTEETDLEKFKKSIRPEDLLSTKEELLKHMLLSMISQQKGEELGKTNRAQKWALFLTTATTIAGIITSFIQSFNCKS